MLEKKMIKSHVSATPDSYLEQPYARMVIKESDGTFRGEILEFPGCIAVGDTAVEALDNLERVADGWLASALARGLTIPEPMENVEYSGKLVLRLPKSLHRKASLAAERDGVSLNQFIVSSVAEQVGERTVTARNAPYRPLELTLTHYAEPTRPIKKEISATSAARAFGTAIRIEDLSSINELPVAIYGR